MTKHKTKHNFKEPVGILNGIAAAVSIATLFSIIFFDPSLAVVFTSGFYLVLFAINSYCARARILGYIFPDWLNWAMALTAVGTILIGIWAISTVL